MKITKQQIEELKNICYTSMDHSPLCTCKGTGKATIEIKKEFCLFPNSLDCNCKEYKVGDVISVPNPDEKAHDETINPILLKIISETEKTWRVVLR